MAKSTEQADYVFVSYAREDRPRLEGLLLDALEYRGISYWYDKHLDWDASWWRDDVRPHLQNAHAVVVVMSESSERSPWVLREITVASESGAPMFPILVDGDVIADLDDRQYLDLSDGSHIPADWLDALAERIRRGRTKRVARRIGRHAVTTVGLFAGLIAIFGFVVPLLTRSQEPLPVFATDYGIGVAEFPLRGEAPEREDVATVVRDFQPRLIAGIAARLTQDEAEASADLATPAIEVLPLPRTLDEAADSNRDAAARRLLADSGADVLVYGDIEADGVALVARPALYLRTLPRAEELAGRFDLDPIGQDVTELAGAQLLRSRIADLGQQLAAIARLIEFYERDEIDEGVGYIEGLRDPGAISGILAIFEGNLRGKAGQYDAAAAAYERALNDPTVADRARLGLNQVRYTIELGADGWCTAQTDVQAMLDVIDGYDALKSATTRSGANIEAKAQLGAGRARLCLESAGLATVSSTGRTDLETVIAQYDAQGDDGDLRELAAEAEGLLGFVDSKTAETDDAQNQALGRLERAIQLTVFSERKIAFRIARADAFARYDNQPAACQEIDEIEQLLGGERSVADLRTRHDC